MRIDNRQSETDVVGSFVAVCEMTKRGLGDEHATRVIEIAFCRRRRHMINTGERGRPKSSQSGRAVSVTRTAIAAVHVTGSDCGYQP